MIAAIRTWLRRRALRWHNAWLRRIYGMQIAPSARISFQARLDKTHPQGLVVGAGAVIAHGAVVLTHDGVRKLHAVTVIGADSFIGCNAIILPGIRIGPQAIVAAGAVVTRDVPANTVVAGNPARIVRRGVQLAGGRLSDRGWNKAG